MTDKKLAKKIIEKLGGFTEFTNMELIDPEGVVTAGRARERIGCVVEKAGDVLCERDEMILPGSSDGEAEAYLAVQNHHEKLAVLRVTGNIDMISAMIGGLKIAVQLIVEYESAIWEGAAQNSGRDHFLNLLFREEPFNPAEIRRCSENLQIEESRMRVPVLIHMEAEKEEIENLYRFLSGSDRFTDQDLMEITKEGWIILFKTVDCPVKQFMQEYKYVMAQFLGDFLHRMREKNIRYSLYFGPVQNDFSLYRQAVRYCEWMQKNIRKSGSFYFYDYVVKYLESEAPVSELNTIFGVLRKQMGKKVINGYMETMEVLIDKDYNLIKASESLHIHKNTLVYRLDKIREQLNMNPLIYNADREFMESFYFYLKRMEDE